MQKDENAITEKFIQENLINILNLNGQKHFVKKLIKTCDNLKHQNIKYWSFDKYSIYMIFTLRDVDHSWDVSATRFTSSIVFFEQFVV